MRAAYPIRTAAGRKLWAVSIAGPDEETPDDARGTARFSVPHGTRNNFTFFVDRVIRRRYRVSVNAGQLPVKREQAMKNRTLIAMVAGVGLIAAAAISQTSVYSANAVGFVKVDFPKGKWTMCSVPLNPMTGAASATLTEILGASTLPVGTKAYYFDTGSQGWQFETFEGVEDPDTGDVIFKWSPGTTMFSVGQGLFVNVPADAPSNTYSVFMTGEVPAGATSTVYQVEGFTIFGYPYPVDANFSSSVFNTNASIGDECYVWTYASNPSGEWAKHTFEGVEDPDTGDVTLKWSPDVVLAPGSAVFYRAISSLSNNVVRPYTYPAE